MHGVAVVGLGKIEHNATLAPVEERKKRDAHSAERACLVACWWLDLDHLRTQLCQDHAACRTHDHVGHFDHPHAFKRHSGFGHGALPLQVSRETLSFASYTKDIISRRDHSWFGNGYLLFGRRQSPGKRYETLIADRVGQRA